MIQRGRACSDQHGGENGVQHVQPVHRAARAHIVAGRGGDQHQEGNVGLGEGNESAGSARQSQFGGARGAHQMATGRCEVAGNSLLRGINR